MNTQSPTWIGWVKQLRAIAQSGLTYSKDPFDRERFDQVMDVAAQIAATATLDETDVIKRLFREERGPSTPKIDVRSAVISGGRVLLVRERKEGLWALPGGWVEAEETPSEAALRELREESGYTARVTKLVAVWDRNKHDHPPHPYHIYKLIFLCDLTGGKSSNSHETDDVGFFLPDALPPLSTSRITERQILRIFEHFHNTDLATDFD